MNTGDDWDPPSLAFVFKNEIPASKIFNYWQSEIADSNEKHLLSISIVRGISQANPHSYKVVVSTNPKVAIADGKARKLAVASCRILQMEPESSLNLDGFLRTYNRCKGF
jgi:hypothetical protein